MNIQIFQKPVVFSHKAKTSFLVPRTSYKVTLYPTRIEIQNIEEKAHNIAVSLDTKGPVEKHFMSLDLQRERIVFSGRCPLGFFSFHLQEKKQRLVLTLKKGPIEGFLLQSKNLSINTVLKPKQDLVLIDKVNTSSSSHEQLSFGMHKSLDMHKIKERKDLKEIFPLWFLLAQKIHTQAPSHRQGVCRYLDRKDTDLEKHFLDLFTMGFCGFVPTLFDYYKGYLDPNESIDSNASPLILLKELGLQIRSLFFEQKKNYFYLLPKLLKPFFCGRLINVSCKDYGTLFLEWSKKRIRKVVFIPEKDEKAYFIPPKEIRSFRLRRNRKDRGTIITPGNSIAFEKKKILYLDRFEK